MSRHGCPGASGPASPATVCAASVGWYALTGEPSRQTTTAIAPATRNGFCAARRNSLCPVSQARGKSRRSMTRGRMRGLGGFPAEHSLDNRGGECVSITIDLRASGGSLRPDGSGRIRHRPLNLSTGRREDLCAPIERRAPHRLHLPVDLGTGGAGHRFEFLVGGDRADPGRFRGLPRGANGVFALSHHAGDGTEQRAVQDDRQHKDKNDDPGGGQVRNQSRVLYHSVTKRVYGPTRSGRPSIRGWTRPTRDAATCAAASAATTWSTLSLAAAINRPPDVCGSYRIHSSSRGTPASTRTPPPKCCWLVPSPPERLAAAISSTPGNTGSLEASILIVTPLARAIWEACPARPNPVTSVQAWTADDGSRSMISAGIRFSDSIDATACSISAAGTRSNLMAVPTMPVPSALVRMSPSPTRAPAFVRIRAGSIAPVIA